MADDGVMPLCFVLEENVVHKVIDCSLQNFLFPPFPRKEGDVIVETLRCESMAMSGSQPMNPMLCQVVPYPTLEENDGHKEREIS